MFSGHDDDNVRRVSTRSRRSAERVHCKKIESLVRLSSRPRVFASVQILSDAALPSPPLSPPSRHTKLLKYSIFICCCWFFFLHFYLIQNSTLISIRFFFPLNITSHIINISFKAQTFFFTHDIFLKNNFVYFFFVSQRREAHIVNFYFQNILLLYLMVFLQQKKKIQQQQIYLAVFFYRVHNANPSRASRFFTCKYFPCT